MGGDGFPAWTSLDIAMRGLVSRRFNLSTQESLSWCYLSNMPFVDAWSVYAIRGLSQHYTKWRSLCTAQKRWFEV
jgi:hypothetical protein